MDRILDLAEKEKKYLDPQNRHTTMIVRTAFRLRPGHITAHADHMLQDEKG
jgi:hypothetical protein